jgi:uncharacterized protein involved in outer membrane biogenesis
MKKKLLLGLTIILAVIAVGLAVLTLKIGDLAAAYKPQIQAKLSEALGADVMLGDLSLSLIPRPELSVTDIAVKGQAGEQPGIALRSLSARASLLPLLSRRLELSTITLDRPVITLVSTQQGTAVQGLAVGSKKLQTGNLPAPPSPVAGDNKAAQSLDVAIRRVVVNDGVLVVEQPEEAHTLKISQVELNSSLELQQDTITIPDAHLSFQISSLTTISTALEDLRFNKSTKAFSLRGSTVTTPAGVVQLSGSSTQTEKASLQINTDGLDLTQLSNLAKAVFPQLEMPSVSGSLASNLSLALTKGAIESLKGPLTLTNCALDLPHAHRIRTANAEVLLEGGLHDLTVALRKASLQYNDAPIAVSADARLRHRELTLTALTLKGFGGDIQAPLRLEMDPINTASVKTSAHTLSIQSLLKAIKNPAEAFLSGTIASLSGDFNSIVLSNPAGTASGSGSIVVKDALIKGMNLPNQLLTKIDGLPFFQGNLRKRVPPEFEAVVSKPDTAIRELSSRFSIQSGILSASELSLASDLFDLKGSGTYTFAGELSMNAQFLFDHNISKALVERVKELKVLTNADGRMVVPVTLSGKVPAVIVTPDLKGLAATVSVDALKETIGEALKDKKGFKKDLGKILGF